ncbi:MAG: PepSY domain-containing protein [Methylocystaceae bacterium]|nr:MAG: PepSY domain-containing protein [Methylocystaceae bacterium]
MEGASGARRRRRPTTRAHEKPMRAILSTIHRWIGLIAGAYFALAGLTGVVLLYRSEIDAWLNAGLKGPSRPAHEGETFRPIDALLAAATDRVPADGKPVFIHLPKSDDGYFDLIYSHPSGHGHPAIGQIVVDPYSGAITGHRVIADPNDRLAEPFVMLIMHLHYTLLAGEIGETIAGLAGLALLGSLASGLYLWRPLAGPWRRALFFKRGAGPDRILFDLHRLTGAYVAPLALVIVVSGVCLIFGAQTGSLIAPFSSVSEHMLPQGLKSEPPRGRPPIGASAAATAVDGLFADGRLMSIAPPNGADGVYRVGKHADGEVYETETKRIVSVDQYSGAILWVQDPREFTVGERILEWRFPLHTGEAFGAGGRAVMTVFGFTPTVLFLTGIVRWRRKKRARHVLPSSRATPNL